MVREAEANASKDARRRQEIELRNQADSLVYSTERTLAEHGAKITDAERTAIEQALADAREALKGDDIEGIRRAQESLTRASQKLAEAMYRETRSGPGNGQQGSAAPKDGDVVDAEFKNVDDQKP